MMNDNNMNMISHNVLKVFKKIQEIEKKTRTYGTDKMLYDAELHIIKAIQENEGIHVTLLADLLKVTKGAVSQNLMKLQKKGMIIKIPDSTNQSRLLLRLTDKGVVAYHNHEKLHAAFENLIEEILKGEPKEQKQFLHDFLTKLDLSLQNFKEE
jgi:DNA-binding MarR family transcriptional regulator